MTELRPFVWNGIEDAWIDDKITNQVTQRYRDIYDDALDVFRSARRWGSPSTNSSNTSAASGALQNRPQRPCSMPIDYRDYPKNWKSELVPAVRKRDAGKCAHCGRRENLKPDDGSEVVRCGVAHLDHDEWNWDVALDRLALLCDSCHLAYDRADNINRAKYGKKYRQTIIEIPFP